MILEILMFPARVRLTQGQAPTSNARRLPPPSLVNPG